MLASVVADHAAAAHPGDFLASLSLRQGMTFCGVREKRPGRTKYIAVSGRWVKSIHVLGHVHACMRAHAGCFASCSFSVWAESYMYTYLGIYQSNKAPQPSVKKP